MSSSQLDDLHEHQAEEALAKALGISINELHDLNYGSIEFNESNDGLIYNSYIEIQRESSSEEVLDKVIANNNCEEYDDYVTVYVTFPDEPDDEYDQEESDDENHNGSRSRPSFSDDDLI